MSERESIMTGLELITGRIISDAEQKAKRIIAESEKKIAAIEEENRLAVENLKRENAVRLEETERRLEERAEAARRAYIREAVLGTKNEAVKKVISEAKMQLMTLPDAEYFALLREIYRNNAEAAEGEILFCAEDKKRLPPDFIEGLCKIRGRVTLSADDAPGAGFVIRCGGVEINCTLDAIFEDKYNKLSDIAAKE